MVMVAFARARCDLQLGPSQSFVDWSAHTAPDVRPGAPPAPQGLPGHVTLGTILASCVPFAAVLLFLLASASVGALVGAAHGVSGSDSVALQARAHLQQLASAGLEEPRAAPPAERLRSTRAVAVLETPSPTRLW